jgi:sulfide:quinone oxidoreductase
VAVPGALTFRGPRDVSRVMEALEALRPLPHPSIVVNGPPGSMWTLPLYELALLAGDWAQREGIDATVEIATAESEPLEAFGPDGSRTVSDLLEQRNIAVWTSAEPRVTGDLVIALPRLEGPAVSGLPSDEEGFIPVDAYCRVHGVHDIFAVGDGAWHPVKQGGLATQQADVAATVIAADVGLPVDPQPYQPVLRAMLLTGEAPLYFRHPAVEDAHAPYADDSRVAPWWPAHKIVGVHLGPYLATHADLMVPVAA